MGFAKKGSGRAGLTYPEALDEALCFGWIDGVRRSVDAERYTIRFTPRKPTSVWSAVNIARARELVAAGRMAPAGNAAFERRDEKRARLYSYERARVRLDHEYERTFRRNARAWSFFQAQPPWYRRTSTWWVMSAKREETRNRRFASLLDFSARSLPLPALDRRPASARAQPPTRTRRS